MYFNDGNGSFILSNQKLPSSNGYHSTSTVKASDIDKDGDLDLFVGERIIPLKYGNPCSGYILQNDGKGNFTNLSSEIAPDLKNIGMITDASFQDLDDDGDEDLVLVGEFMGIEFFINEKFNSNSVVSKNNSNFS